VIDRDWLHEQYVVRGRTLPDLAREKNMSTTNMARWARFHEIPLRPRGGASHDLFLRTVDQAGDLPAPIAKAVTSPYAWQRLNRFASAIGYHTLSEAAEHLGTTQSALTTQIDRMERDIGGPLLERAERGRPMTPTALGEQVLAALHRTSQLDSAFSASLRRASAARLVRSVRCRDQSCFVGGDDELDPVPGVQLGQ